MNRKFILVYAIFAVAVVGVITISMFVIKKEESLQEKEQKQKEELNEITEYINENKVIKNIKVKLTGSNQIVEIDMDEYLKGVVPAEMPPSYDIEALRAQAIVARTYTYEKMISGGHVDCDICDNYAHCQAYYNKEKIFSIWEGRGYDEKTKNEYWAKVEEAVNSTNAICITYKGEYIKAYFHANSGGKTEASSEIWGKQSIPYLVPVESLGEENHNWYKSNVEVSISELENKMNERSDKACNIDVNSNNVVEILSYTISGRVGKVKIGNNIFDATELRTALGLKSTNFTVEQKQNSVAFNVTGYGHGVGMSQTGANYYANQGWTYKEIIKHYYTGVDVLRLG